KLFLRAVSGPVPLDDARAQSLRDRTRRVGGMRINDYNFVTETYRSYTGLDPIGLVVTDDACRQRDSHALRATPTRSRKATPSMSRRYAPASQYRTECTILANELRVVLRSFLPAAVRHTYFAPAGHGRDRGKRHPNRGRAGRIRHAAQPDR